MAEIRPVHRLLQVMISIFFRLLQLAFHFILRFIYNGPGEPLQAIDNLILLDSAVTLAQKIRNRKLTSVEVVQSFINRIKEINQTLNSVVDNRFEEALVEAQKADDFIKNSGKTKEELSAEYPFLGVPFSLKDAICAKGMSITSGLYYRRGMKAEEDADVIVCMKKAGAIPLVITNVPEYCMWWETSNKIHGRTNNAYNTNHIVGGSSGGEGCLLSAAGSPMGIGSDIGGSIRIPAFFNGVFGHKPSANIVSLKGHFPQPKGEQDFFLSCGPMSRFAMDLRPMLKVMTPGQNNTLRLDEKVDISKLKFYYMEDDCGGVTISPVAPEIRDCIRKVVAYIKTTHNITATKVKLSAFKNSTAMWLAKMTNPGGPVLPKSLVREGSVNPLWELIKAPFGLSNHTLPIIFMALMEQIGEPYGSPKHQYLVDKANRLKMELRDLLGSDGVFLYPTHPTAAPFHTEPLAKPFNFSYTAVFNFMGVPVTHCPMGLNKSGLPIGIQVAANINQDRLTLAVAEELERAFGGWVSPSPSL